MDFRELSIVRMIEYPDMDGNMRFEGYAHVAGPFGDEAAVYAAASAIEPAERWDMLVRDVHGEPDAYGVRDSAYEYVDDWMERQGAMAESAVG